jgi:hypothetical protein
MSSTTADCRALARLTAALTRVSDRVHAVGDQRARAAGWTVAVVPGPAGLNGRAYRHPLFAAGHRGRAGRSLPAPAPARQPEGGRRCAAS